MSYDISALLPPYLNLPPHLSAHKYFFVCTLTVAAWDTLVLSPRSWRLMKTKEWPVLKIVFQVLRYLMPIEFIIVAVAFFDTKWTQEMCNRFYLFEPICTMVLIAFCSSVHVIRIHAIYDRSRPILAGLAALLLVQVSFLPTFCLSDKFGHRRRRLLLWSAMPIPMSMPPTRPTPRCCLDVGRTYYIGN